MNTTNAAVYHRSPCLMGAAITDNLPAALRRPAVLPLPRSGCATAAVPSLAYHRAMVATLQIRQHGVSPLVAAIRDYADAVFDAAEELKADASNIITAFARKHGTVAPITREFASAFLLADRGTGIVDDDHALAVRAAIEAELNLLEMREDVEQDEFPDDGVNEYVREEFPALAQESEWMSDDGWLALCAGGAA